MAELSNLRKRRGAAKASITKLSSRLRQLESKVHEPSTFELAQQLMLSLKALDARFKEQHFSIIDIIDESDKDSLAKEQDILDRHDEEHSVLVLRVQQLVQKCSLASESGCRKIVSRSLTDLRARIDKVQGALARLSGNPEESHLYYHYQEQLQDFKSELSAIRQNVLSMSADEAGNLLDSVSSLDKQICDLSIIIKGFLYPNKAHSADAEATPTPGVKLPKLDVPIFDGDILSWNTFWEQFCIAIHDRKELTDAEKLAYLRHSLKDGAAKSAVEGLSHTGIQYAEAIECLVSRYDRPKLIHQAHVKSIVNIPSLKDGTGKELRRLHDTAQQHIRALKSLGSEPDGPFLTSFLQLKLDPTTLFEWQRYDQDSKKVSGYDKFLRFIDLRAQASECLTSERSSKSPQSDNLKRGSRFSRSATFTASVGSNCVVCKGDKHALFICPQFKSMSRGRMLSIIRSNELCINCLKPGHFAKQCPSSNRCRKCDKSHHTLIHDESKESKETSGSTASLSVSATTFQPSFPITTPDAPPSSLIASNASVSRKANVLNTLLMTCQVMVVAPNGTSIKARTLLDPASTMSFVSERVVQSLGLGRLSQRLTVSGIGGMTSGSSYGSVSTFRIASLYMSQAKFVITAIVKPQVTCDLPLYPVHSSTKWNHISGLFLADPDFAKPSKIDLLLGADIYNEIMLQGRRCGQHGTPTAFETCFGWVLVGKTHTRSGSA